MEILDVINLQDEVVSAASKAEVREKGLMCRVAFIMISNQRDEFFLQQRKATKLTYPLYWSGAAAGHVVSGETYEQGAQRELQEELGVNAPLQFIGRFYSEVDKEMVGVFLGRHEGPFHLEQAAIEQAEFFGLDALAAQRQTMKMTSYLTKALSMIESTSPGIINAN